MPSFSQKLFCIEIWKPYCNRSLQKRVIQCVSRWLILVAILLIMLHLNSSFKSATKASHCIRSIPEKVRVRVIQRVAQAVASIVEDIVIEDLSIDGKEGCMQSGGDSFCQTWSLLFLKEDMFTGSFEFFKTWISVNSDARKRLITEFILEILDAYVDAKSNYELQIMYRKPGFEVVTVLRSDL